MHGSTIFKISKKGSTIPVLLTIIVGHFLPCLKQALRATKQSVDMTILFPSLLHHLSTSCFGITSGRILGLVTQAADICVFSINV